jgi:hypothetical protein
MQNFPGGGYRARHETLLVEAASDRRAAEVRRSSAPEQSVGAFDFATSLSRSVANLLRHVKASRAQGKVGTMSVRKLSRVGRG